MSHAPAATPGTRTTTTGAIRTAADVDAALPEKLQRRRHARRVCRRFSLAQACAAARHRADHPAA
jgi:hypothetical protein